MLMIGLIGNTRCGQNCKIVIVIGVNNVTDLIHIAIAAKPIY